MVEMAVVVMLAGMLLAFGLSVATTTMDNSRRSTTRERQEMVRDVMVAYFVTNKRFPCPDTGSNVGNTGPDGVENRAVGGANPLVTSGCSAALGTVPFATLGISREHALDGYGNFMTYRLDTARNWHLSSTFPPSPAVCPTIVIGLSVFSAGAVQATNQAAWILTSHGSNGTGAYNQGITNGSRNTLPSTQPELGNTQLNPAAPAGYRSYAYSDSATAPFDDMLVFMTASELLTALVKTGKPNLCS